MTIAIFLLKLSIGPLFILNLIALAILSIPGLRFFANLTISLRQELLAIEIQVFRLFSMSLLLLVERIYLKLSSKTYASFRGAFTLKSYIVEIFNQMKLVVNNLRIR